MKFWKFEYPGSAALDDCISCHSLPSGKAEFQGLKNTFTHPLKSMKVGDGVVMATLQGDEAKFFALGKVRSINIESNLPVIQWTATTHTHYPDARGGLINWQTKSAFEISPEPAKKYGLRELIAYYVKDDDEPDVANSMEAMEGLIHEVTILSHGRNASLRRAALANSKGACEACSIVFTTMLGGMGVHVLQVHHRQQLALRDVPSVTRLEDLAVVCANCHALIHMNPKHALPVEYLQKMLAAPDSRDTPPTV